ncbi:MAG: hypothetical protein KDD61_02815 [Bdellovibrionales bacterium]|nr:hypothetical protein [Bdellovibrionales bacterium]
MMKGIRLIIIITVVLSGLGFAGSALASVNQPTNYVMCKNRKIVRSIRVIQNDEGSCKTIYTKSGVDRIVGNGRRIESCLGYLKNIEENLGAAAWKCKDVTSAATIAVPKAKVNESTNTQ